jgi:hypothetical protein
MILNETIVLWLLMLAVVVGLLVPMTWKWGKLLIWSCLTLLTLVLILLHSLVLRC